MVLLLTVRPNENLSRSDEKNEQAFARKAVLDKLLDSAHNGPFKALDIQLHGLEREDADKLVARVLGASEEDGVDQSVLDFIYDKTDGFPMYVTMLLEWIKERKLLIKVPFVDILTWVSPDTPQKEVFPNSLADTMIAKFDRLEPEAKNLIKLASVMSHLFDATALCALANMDLGKNQLTEEQVLASLDEARELGIVAVDTDKKLKVAAHKWHFKHDEMVAAVQSLIPEERRTQLSSLLKPMQQQVDKKKLAPLFAGFLGEVDDDD